MEGFSYVDIFATKGVEYLLVITVLLLFVPFWRLLNRSKAVVYEIAESVVPAIGEWFDFPEGIYYHQGHSWAMLGNKDVVTVGIDDFAQKLVGKIDAIQVPKVGATVAQGEKAWSLKVGSKSIDMLSPVNGKILDVNEELLNSPKNVNKDPYGESWLMKVQVPKVTANLKNLLSGKLAKKWMEEVKENLLTKMNYNLGAVYQDGGVPVSGIARNLDQERWDEVAKEFFLSS